MPNPTKSERRDEARAEAARLREEQQRTARRQRTIAITLVSVAVVVLVAVVAWILSNQPEPAPDLSKVDDPLGSVSAPATANDQGGIPVGSDGVAGAVGDSDATQVVVYSDYMCPVCGLFEETNGATLNELRESGDIVVDYRPVSILDRTSQGSQFSTRSATAAAFVADQDPASFVAFNEAMFANQPGEGSTGMSDEQIAEIARTAGVDDEVAAAIADGTYFSGEDSFAPWVTASTEQATRDFPDGFGTPTILIDGENLADMNVDWRAPGALASAIESARG